MEEKGRLNWAFIIGGKTMDRQFNVLRLSQMNLTCKSPLRLGVDISIIANSGRFLHLVVEISQLRWDRKKKRFLTGDAVGADNKRVIRTESGAFLPATYRSGRFEIWQAQKRALQSQMTLGNHHSGRAANWAGKYRAVMGD